MYCNNCGKYMRDTERFCSKCGNQLSQSSATKQCEYCFGEIEQSAAVCPFCHRKQPNATYRDEPAMTTGYITLSYISFIIFFVIGIIDLSTYIKNGWNYMTYKSIIICMASFVFLPQVKVSSASPYVSYGIKFFAAILLIFIL